MLKKRRQLGPSNFLRMKFLGFQLLIEPKPGGAFWGFTPGAVAVTSEVGVSHHGQVHHRRCGAFGCGQLRGRSCAVAGGQAPGGRQAGGVQLGQRREGRGDRDQPPL